MSLRMVGVLAAALAFIAPVQAQSSYGSGFTVTQQPPVGAPDPTAPARWVDNTFRLPDSASAHVVDQVGFENGVPVWGTEMGRGNSDSEFVMVYGEGLRTGIYASAHVTYPFNQSISAGGSIPETGGQIGAVAKWQNEFEIDPGATFAGIAGLSVYGDAAPLQPVSSIVSSDLLSFASLVYADATDRVGFGLTAWADRLGGLFSLTNNAGLVSLSITNNTASLLTGTLRVASYVNVTSIASPAPEPETYAMLLLGLAVVGAAAKRRKAAQR